MDIHLWLAAIPPFSPDELSSFDIDSIAPFTPQLLDGPVDPADPFAFDFEPDTTGSGYAYTNSSMESRVETPEPNQSRRVLLTGLPSDTNISQVLKGVFSRLGGVVGGQLCDTGSIFQDHTQTAIVEFKYSGYAIDFAHFVRSHGVSFTSGDGSIHGIEARVIGVSPNPWLAAGHKCLEMLAPSVHGWRKSDLWNFERSQTRQVVLSEFPASGIWHLLVMVGIKHIVNVDFDFVTETLSLEFTTLFQANLAYREIKHGRIPFFQPDNNVVKGHMEFEQEPRVRDLDPLNSEHQVIPFVSATLLEDEWDQEPFNGIAPPESLGSQGDEESSRVSVEGPLSPLAWEESQAAIFGIDVDELDDYYEECSNWRATEYRIVGSNIKIIRRAFGWSISVTDELKLQMANTLHDPDWADYWDEHFRSNGLVNLRTWEQYGMSASHRRQVAKEKGLESWVNPCCRGLDCGCPAAGSPQVPKVISDWLENPDVCVGADGSSSSDEAY